MRAEPVTHVALVVEDEWFVREHVVTELKAQGWSIVETATGENALAVLSTDDGHLLLTDIQFAGGHRWLGSCSCATC
jgi:CheY-like chemotaxis protein